MSGLRGGEGSHGESEGDAPGLLVQLDPHWATAGDGSWLPGCTYKRGVTGPNPVAPTRSEAIFGILPKSQAVNGEPGDHAGSHGGRSHARTPARQSPGAGVTVTCGIRLVLLAGQLSLDRRLVLPGVLAGDHPVTELEHVEEPELQAPLFSRRSLRATQHPRVYHGVVHGKVVTEVAVH